jgi:hypothetical protein
MELSTILFMFISIQLWGTWGTDSERLFRSTLVTSTIYGLDATYKVMQQIEQSNAATRTLSQSKASESAKSGSSIVVTVPEYPRFSFGGILGNNFMTKATPMTEAPLLWVVIALPLVKMALTVLIKFFCGRKDRHAHQTDSLHRGDSPAEGNALYRLSDEELRDIIGGLKSHLKQRRQNADTLEDEYAEEYTESDEELQETEQDESALNILRVEHTNMDDLIRQLGSKMNLLHNDSTSRSNLTEARIKSHLDAKTCELRTTFQVLESRVSEQLGRIERSFVIEDRRLQQAAICALTDRISRLEDTSKNMSRPDNMTNNGNRFKRNSNRVSDDKTTPVSNRHSSSPSEITAEANGAVHARLEGETSKSSERSVTTSANQNAPTFLEDRFQNLEAQVTKAVALESEIQNMKADIAVVGKSEAASSKPKFADAQEFRKLSAEVNAFKVKLSKLEHPSKSVPDSESIGKIEGEIRGLLSSVSGKIGKLNEKIGSGYLDNPKEGQLGSHEPPTLISAVNCVISQNSKLEQEVHVLNARLRFIEESKTASSPASGSSDDSAARSANQESSGPRERLERLERAVWGKPREDSLLTPRLPSASLRSQVKELGQSIQAIQKAMKEKTKLGVQYVDQCDDAIVGEFSGRLDREFTAVGEVMHDTIRDIEKLRGNVSQCRSDMAAWMLKQADQIEIIKTEQAREIHNLRVEQDKELQHVKDEQTKAVKELKKDVECNGEDLEIILAFQPDIERRVQNKNARKLTWNKDMSSSRYAVPEPATVDKPSGSDVVKRPELNQTPPKQLEKAQATHGEEVAQVDQRPNLRASAPEFTPTKRMAAVPTTTGTKPGTETIAEPPPNVARPGGVSGWNNFAASARGREAAGYQQQLKSQPQAAATGATWNDVTYEETFRQVNVSPGDASRKVASVTKTGGRGDDSDKKSKDQQSDLAEHPSTSEKKHMGSSEASNTPSDPVRSIYESRYAVPEGEGSQTPIQPARDDWMRSPVSGGGRGLRGRRAGSQNGSPRDRRRGRGSHNNGRASG